MNNRKEELAGRLALALMFLSGSCLLIFSLGVIVVDMPMRGHGVISGLLSCLLAVLLSLGLRAQRSRSRFAITAHKSLQIALMFTCLVTFNLLSSSASQTQSYASEAFARIRHLESSFVLQNIAISSQFTQQFFRLNEIDDFIETLHFIHGATIEESAIKDEARRGIDSHVAQLKRHTGHLADSLHQYQNQMKENLTSIDPNSHEANSITWKAEAAKNLLAYLQTNDILSISSSEHQLIAEALIDGATTLGSSTEGPRISSSMDLDALQALKEEISRGDIATKIDRLKQKGSHQSLQEASKGKRNRARESWDSQAWSHPTSHPSLFTAERNKAIRDETSAGGSTMLHWIYSTLTLITLMSQLACLSSLMSDEDSKWGRLD